MISNIKIIFNCYNLEAHTGYCYFKLCYS